MKAYRPSSEAASNVPTAVVQGREERSVRGIGKLGNQERGQATPPRAGLAEQKAADNEACGIWGEALKKSAKEDEEESDEESLLAAPAVGEIGYERVCERRRQCLDGVDEAQPSTGGISHEFEPLGQGHESIDHASVVSEDTNSQFIQGWPAVS